MSIYLAGTEISNVRLGGAQVSRVMVGTGSTALEAWPGTVDINYDFNFSYGEEVKWAPITFFDFRTHASSPRNAPFIWSDMYVAGDNNQVSYHNRLVDHRMTEFPQTIKVTMGDALQTESRPSWMVLASDISGSNMLWLEYGTNAVTLKRYVNGALDTISSRHPLETALVANDVLEVRWTPSLVSIYKNGQLLTSVGWPAYLAPFVNPSVPMYAGFGLFSTESQWSSRMQRVQIIGKSTAKTTDLVATEHAKRFRPAASTWEVAAHSIIHTGGVANIKFEGVWNYASSSATRQFRLRRNSTVLTTTADEGLVATANNVTLSPGDSVYAEVYSGSGTASYRDLIDGRLTIFGV